MKLKKNILTTGICLLALSSSASAANILLNSNLADGSNWSVAGETANSQFVTSSGLHIGFDGGDGFNWYTSNTAGITVTQTVTTVGAGDFVLSADALQRNDAGVPASHGSAVWTLELLDGGAALTADSTTGAFPGTSTPGGGDPATSVSRTYNGLAAGTYTVQYTIASGQGAIDNVELDFTPVPEPSSTALLGLGGIALILRRKK